MPQFRKFAVALTFERIVGGIPIVLSETDAAKVYRGWLKGQKVDGTDAAELADKLAADPDMPVVAEEPTAIGFRRDTTGPYIEARQINAMLREAAQRLGYLKQIRGSKQVLQHDLHIRDLSGKTQKLYLYPLPDGTPDRTVIGLESRPISVVTPQGPRTSIKAFEYAADVRVGFTIHLLTGGIADGQSGLLIDEPQLREMLQLGEWLGLGADRSQGEGCFVIERFEEITETD